MSEVMAAADKLALREEHRVADDKTLFGFWVYIMTDCVLFAGLFATYMVLHMNTFGGTPGEKLFSLPYALAETLVLLTSSFTCGLAVLSAQARKKNLVLFWFGVTALLGLTFLGLELHEFRDFVIQGDSWRRSGFLSAFFTLVGTHGLHITTGLIWMGTMMSQIFRRGLTRQTVRRLTMLSLFWHFLDVVWIFIFTIVYLMGIAG
jgi:cytochrome o ubiquinol oxidase subunit III